MSALERAYKWPPSEIRGGSGPYEPGLSLNNLSVNKPPRGDTTRGFSLSIAQWNIRCLNEPAKISFVNAIDTDIVTLQEVRHPTEEAKRSLLKQIVHTQERDLKMNGGGTMTLSRLTITHKLTYPINQDTVMHRLVIDNVFVIWLCNVYLNRGQTSQLQRIFSVILNSVPDSEISNILLIGDYNIDLSNNCSKSDLMNKTCKQFQLTTHKSNHGTRGSSMIDFIICGKNIRPTLNEQLNTKSLSDHDLILWNIELLATTRPPTQYMLNSKLGKEITELSVRNKLATNSANFLGLFLSERKAREKESCIAIRRKRPTNDTLRDIMLSVRDEKTILKDIKQYWQSFWSKSERKRYSPMSKETFRLMRTICRYHEYEKRDGGVVNRILSDSDTIVTDPNEISRLLIEVLKSIQQSPHQKQYTGEAIFPKLEPLDQLEMELLLARLAHGKACSYDLFSDTVLSQKDLVKRISSILNDLWSSDILNWDLAQIFFKARLMPLNKLYPNLPRKEDFRPIMILSVILKILETRFLPKLETYMIESMHTSQTGFVPGQGVFVNIFRALRQIKSRTDAKKPCYALFIDFKSAYNFARHDILFKRLEGILTPEEIEFQRCIYDKLVIQHGDHYFRPNIGVAQGSTISPALFNIYVEPLLRELSAIISNEDIFAYADDVMFICDNLERLEKCIKVLENWSSLNNMVINRKKSAIMEFMHRRSKKPTLTINSTLYNYPVTDKYKFLGTWLNCKLTLDDQMRHIAKKTYFLRSRLNVVLQNASLDYRKNLWQIFVVPMYEFCAPLYAYESSKTKMLCLNRMLRGSFRSYSGLKKTVKLSLLTELMGYDMNIRSEELKATSELKWQTRLQGEIYHTNLTQHAIEPGTKKTNACKYMPNTVVQYINMQTSLCPTCKSKNIRSQCNDKHLRKTHQIAIINFEELRQHSIEIEEQQKSIKKVRIKNKNQAETNVKPKRTAIIEALEKFLSPSLSTLNSYLSRT